jgi:hypothetical protein
VLGHDRPEIHHAARRHQQADQMPPLSTATNH